MTNYDRNDFKLLVRKCSLILKITDILDKEGCLTHNELAKRTGKSIQSLSNAIRKIDPFGVLFIRRIGKNVYYSLNFRGNLLKDYLSNEVQNVPLKIVDEPIYVPDDVVVNGVKR